MNFIKSNIRNLVILEQHLTVIEPELKQVRTYAKLDAVGAIHELPLRKNKGFSYCLRKSCKCLTNYRSCNECPHWITSSHPRTTARLS